jgi:hypothetical protein
MEALNYRQQGWFEAEKPPAWLWPAASKPIPPGP